MQFLPYIFSLPQTVFTLNELELLFPQIPSPLLRKRAHYFVKTNQLLRPRAGIYTKIEFDWLELGNKIYSPSYISFQTVLQKAGLIFQPYETIYLASYLSRSLSISGQIFHYRKLRDDILLNHEGVSWEKNYSIASKEHAFPSRGLPRWLRVLNKSIITVIPTKVGIYIDSRSEPALDQIGGRE